MTIPNHLTYDTGPTLMRDVLLIQAISVDPAASIRLLAQLVAHRTSLTLGEVHELTLDEFETIGIKVMEHLATDAQLSVIANSLAGLILDPSVKPNPNLDGT